MSFDWPVLRPMRFLAKSRLGNTHTNNASSYISSRGFTLQSASAGCRLQRSHYSPGTIFQGQLNLHLLKAIPSPCQLRIVLSCHQTITPTQHNLTASSTTSSQSTTPLFEVEHILIDNETLAAKRHYFHFSIKFPMCNFAPSYKDENGRSVVFSAQAFLTFETQSTKPSKAELCSPELELKYLPLVPASIPRNEVVENAQMVDSTTNQVSISATVDSSQRGMCPGESLPLTFNFTNNSQSDLQTIHIALVRQASFASSPTSHDASSFSSPEYSLIHSTTIPISRPSNMSMSWSQPVQFILPPSLDLVPTTNITITPLLRIDYFLVVNIPVSRHHGLGRIPFGLRQLSLPIVNDTIFSTSSGNNSPLSRCINIKGLTVLQFAPIPVTMGTVPSRIPTSRLKWPLPSHAEVGATPVFVRDRFEEEMLKHLSSMESLMMEEDDEQDIAELVKAAEARRLSLGEIEHHNHSSSGSGSDEEDDVNMHRTSRSSHLHSTLPIRFRQGSLPPRHGLKRSLDVGMSPPPSPPSTSRTVLEDAMTFHALSQPQAQARSKVVPMPSQVLGPSCGRLSTSPRSSLGKELLMGLHQTKVHHMRPEGLQDI
ncbi:hypothetical protein BGZ82_000955 [Podila clonocystis]|nr:hypothetical protein BGZ82_000955 [Podila clonocystis]